MALDGEGSPPVPAQGAVCTGGSIATVSATPTRPAQNCKRAANRGNKQQGPKKMKQIDSFFRATPVNQSGLPARESEVNATIPEANVPEVLNQGTDTNNLQANVPQRFNQVDIEADPGLWKQIEEYATPEIRDEVRRAYLTKGPCQPKDHDFKHNEDDRAFRAAWYKEFDWLEFSVAKDAAYCFYYFLFKKPTISSKFGGEVFTKTGYTNWRKAVKNCRLHVGSTKSAHNNSRTHCEDFKNLKQSVVYAITTQTEKAHIGYQSRLMAVVGVVRFLLRQGLAFRGHDESKNSRNKGNFCEMLDWYAQRRKEAANVLHDNAPRNHQMTCHDIQKQLVQACAEKPTEFMMNEHGDGQFSLLVDESRDASIMEQMAVIVRFVNKQGETLERLLCVEHVVDTTSASLKRSLDKVFATHNLSMSRLRGQGYDGASNMRGQLNGLKKLVLDDNPHAFYVHCFAHQLQLVVVAVVKGVLAVSDFFGYTNILVTTVSASCRRKDALLQKHHDKIVLQLENEEVMKGRGKHQETTIARPGDTRWGSH